MVFLAKVNLQAESVSGLLSFSWIFCQAICIYNNNNKKEGYCTSEKFEIKSRDKYFITLCTGHTQGLIMYNTFHYNNQ